MFSKTTLAFALSTTLLVGCTNAAIMDLNIDSGKGKLFTAEHRTLLVTEKGGFSGDKRVVCAEPSPDAITSLAYALSASGGTPKIGAALGFGSSEAAASIGLRTQTIQLLRDGYYRLCEGYMNGALSREQYNFALVNIDHLMIPLMAIDAIAGTPRPPAVAISPGNPGSSASTNLLAGVPGTGEDGAGAQPASLNGTASVGTTNTVLTIETIQQSRTGLNKDETDVLKQALALVEGSSLPPLCASYLADPEFGKENGPENKFQRRLAEACAKMIEQKVSSNEQTLNAVLTEANKKLKKAEASLDKAIKALKSAITESDKDKELKIAQKAQVKLARDLAEKALERPSVIVK